MTKIVEEKNIKEEIKMKITKLVEEKNMEEHKD